MARSNPDLAAPFALLLERCPHIRLLVASRSLLQLDCEQVHVLDGFPLPDADETDADVLASNDGVHYFATVMSHAGQPVELTHNACHIAALVHAVEGLPLALRLLAKLTRVFSLPPLLDSVRNAMAGATESSSSGLGGLMPALIASFDRSWTALSPVEQAVLSSLAVFPADCEVAAACAVAGTELPVITSLMDRSLVRPEGAGRLSLHAGIRACVLALRPLTEGTIAAYVEHYRQRAAALSETARVKSVRPLQRFLSDEEAHVKHAWQLALDRRAYAALLSLAETVAPVLAAPGSYGVDGASLFEHAEMLIHEPTMPVALRALLLAEAAAETWRRSHFELAGEQARLALRAAQQSKCRAATRSGLITLAKTLLVQRNTRQADALIARLAAMYNEADMAGREHLLLDVQATFNHMTGRYDEALRLIDQVIADRRRREDTSAVVRAGNFKVITLYHSGELARARQTIDQLAVEASDRNVSRIVELRVLADAAQLYYECEDFVKANVYIKRANVVASSCLPGISLALRLQAVNGALSVQAADLDSAALHLSPLLAALGSGELPALAMEAFIPTAQWFRLAGDRDGCVAVLRAIHKHAFSSSKPFEQVQAMLRELGEAPQPETEVMPGDPKIGVAEAATAARRRMLAWLDEKRRDDRR